MKTLLLILLLISTPCWATTYQVVTGYGYVTDSNGHVIQKCQFLPGPVDVTTGVYTEVANQAALDAITIYSIPIPPTQTFNTDLFVQQLAQTSLITDPAIMQYYAVLKDLTFYKNFQGLANLIAALLQGGAINQAQVDTIDSALENQQINLDSYNAQINVAY